MAKMIIFATRKDSFDVYDAIENAGGDYYTMQVKAENAFMAAFKANGIKPNVNGDSLELYLVDEVVYNAIASLVDVVATISWDEQVAAVKAVNANYPSKMDKVTFKAYKADKAKALESVVRLVGADAVEAEFTNPYNVGDVVEDYVVGSRIHYKVLKVTDKGYTIAPILPKDGHINHYKIAEAKFSNVDVKVKDPNGQMEDFFIPMVGNEDGFDVMTDRKRNVRIGKPNRIGLRKGLLSKVDPNKVGYHFYIDCYR